MRRNWMIWIGLFASAAMLNCHASEKRVGNADRHAEQQKSAEYAPSGAPESPSREKPSAEGSEVQAEVKEERAPRDDSRRRRERRDRPKVNPMTETSEDALSTFAVDVDTGSYTKSRRAIQSGKRPDPSSVRVEEFVNYFDYGYAGPERGPFTVHTDAAPSPWSGEPNRKLMRVGVQGDRLSDRERKPVHLTFLVDVSGSMKSRDKLGLAKRSMKLLTENLRPNDTVALATYSGRTAKVLDPTPAKRLDRIQSAITELHAGGSTAMNSGLEIAYKLALKNYERDHVNRVVVLSDGDANVGPSSHEKILDQIDRYVDEGVTLSTIGFGTGNYRDSMMEQLANNGNGNYYYIDGMDQARRVFGEKLSGMLQVIAKDVKIQVEFEEDAVRRYRLVGYENRDIADHNFRNDRVDAGEIGAGHSVTAIYELEVAPEAEGRLATVRVRHKPPKGSEASEQSFAFETSDVHADLHEASPSFQFAASVAAFAEKLRKSPYAEDLDYGLVEELASASTEGRAEREEFVELVRRVR